MEREKEKKEKESDSGARKTDTQQTDTQPFTPLNQRQRIAERERERAVNVRKVCVCVLGRLRAKKTADRQKTTNRSCLVYTKRRHQNTEKIEKKKVDFTSSPHHLKNYLPLSLCLDLYRFFLSPPPPLTLLYRCHHLGTGERGEHSKLI